MLPQSFFAQPVNVLAQQLLGCELVHIVDGKITSGIIVEVEAYHQSDEASHSYRGETTRTRAMFGPAGHAYIYFTYGMHYCFNITAEEEGVGAGVLIRALEPLAGIEHMQLRRNQTKLTNLCNGPAKLVQAMGITKADYGKPLYSGSNLYVGERPDPDKIIKISTGPRVGISKAIEKPWRYWIKGSAYISK